ncbi:MAG: SUMF1/EgtB/PvdO family nonheme iron enzyme [Myxococcaceae bacterium]|nr:SUMF1/EgtB/PvdO family nonheme iron enzyme [Myxococcaceae bacterium]
MAMWTRLLIVAVSATVTGCASAARTPPPAPPPEVAVPAGPFLMGTSQEKLELVYELCRAAHPEPTRCNREKLLAHHRNETPQREVYLSAFSIGRTEVTNADYERCVRAGGCTPLDFERCIFFVDDKHVRGGTLEAAQARPDSPVVCVSWEQAAAYCRHAGGALPTEAQWEKAARGEDGRVFPWGDTWEPLRANSGEGEHPNTLDGHATTAPVGSFPSGASPYGALDMAGNVWEWVADWYAEDAYSHGPSRDPRGPETGTARIMRGGGYAANSFAQRTTKRIPRDPLDSYVNIGFRCAHPAPEG